MVFVRSNCVSRKILMRFYDVLLPSYKVRIAVTCTSGFFLSFQPPLESIFVLPWNHLFSYLNNEISYNFYYFFFNDFDLIRFHHSKCMSKILFHKSLEKSNRGEENVAEKREQNAQKWIIDKVYAYTSSACVNEWVKIEHGFVHTTTAATFKFPSEQRRKRNCIHNPQVVNRWVWKIGLIISAFL